MSFLYEDRPSDSPFIRNIWRTQSETNGCYTAVVDGCWDLLVIKQQGETRAFLAGAATEAKPIIYEQGSHYLGICFKMGTYMPQLSGRVLLNSVMPLQKSSARSFWLHDSTFQFPDFDHVETFIARLVRNGLLMRDRAVEDLLNDQTPPLSVRSMQRRVAHVTRLTLRLVHQIQRAHCTSALLHNGISIADTVHAAGYADQSHMTRSLKRFLGRTPAEIVRQIQA